MHEVAQSHTIHELYAVDTTPKLYMYDPVVGVHVSTPRRSDNEG